MERMRQESITELHYIWRVTMEMLLPPSFTKHCAPTLTISPRVVSWKTNVSQVRHSTFVFRLSTDFGFDPFPKDTRNFAPAFAPAARFHE
jgi:hypothetical protein